MAQILDDNTVVPHFQGLIPRGQATDTGNLTNLALRMGEVKDIIYKTDPQSITKQFTEYSVEVQHRDGRGPGTTSRYAGCLVASLFGGAADVLRYTLRKDNGTNTGPDGIGVGSKVLLLCVNGQTTRAMIIAGLRDIKTNSKDADDPALGHNLFFEFNGISFSVNKDGEARIQFRGPTKVDGSLDTAAGANANNGPTAIEFLKNGNLHISTKAGQEILLDHANKKASFVFDTEWNVKVNKKVVEDYGDSWQTSVGTSIKIEAQKDITFNSSAGAWNLGAAGNLKIKTAGVLTGAATDATMMGDTYRRAEQTLHQQLTTGFTSLTTQLGIISAAANGPMAIPVYGASIAGPIIGTAAAQMATAVGQMIAAIQSFEGQAAKYLSLKNKSD